MSTDDTTLGRGRLTTAAFSGMQWSYVNAGFAAVMQLVYVSIMAHVLSPDAFGQMAIALLTVNFAQHLSQMGVAQALIQKDQLTNDDIRAGVTASVGLGVICFAVLWVIAPLIADFFSEPAVDSVLRVMGLQFVILSLGVTSQGLLRRDLRFRALTLTELSGGFIGIVVGIGSALAGAGVWSLVASVLSGNLVGAVLQYGVTRHALRPVLAVRRFSSLYSFGIRMSGLNLMQFLSKQMDTFAVGRYSTTAMLGQYNRAFTIVSAPLSRHLTMALSRVLLPTYSRIKNDTARLQRAYQSLLTIGGAMMLSIAAGMAVAASEIVAVVLGDQWGPAAAFVPFFAFALALRTLTNFADVLAQARAELNRIIVLQVAYLVLLGMSYVFVSGWNEPLLFAVVLFGGEVVRHVAFAQLLRGVIGLRLRDIWRAYGSAFICAAGTAAFVLLARTLGHTFGAPVIVVLFGELGAGALGLPLTVRLNPLPDVRVELIARLHAAGVLDTRVRANLARAFLGSDDRMLVH